ncbi:MAG: YdcH family protein [Acidobacteriota bacterium]
MDEVKLKDYLMETDQEFRKLAQQHHEYELELERFNDKPYLNEQDQFQEAVIKKKKLALKDQMQMLISRYQTQQQAR